jgi:hypothetical protein
LTPAAWRQLIGYYVAGYAPALVLVVLAAWLLRARLRTEFRSVPNEWRVALGLSVVPAAAFHAVLFNLSAVHSYTALKGALFLCLVGGWAAARLKPKELVAVWTAAIVAGAGLYLAVFVQHDPPYGKIGRAIAQQARPDEVVFVVGKKNAPATHQAVILYAHRNIALWTSDADARALVVRDHASDGVVFSFDRTGQVESVRRVSP